MHAVLFDLDGTLLDTAADMAGALNELRRLERLGPLPLEVIRPHVSHGAIALVRLGFPGSGERGWAELRERFLHLYGRRLALETQPYAGVLDALTRIESSGIRWGVVTNKPGWLTGPLLEQLSLDHRAGIVVSGDTLAERKPHPAPLLHAATALGATPDRCVYIGDAERDALAAQAAGMKCFVALYGYIPTHERPREWPACGWLETPQAMTELLDEMIADRQVSGIGTRL